VVIPFSIACRGVRLARTGSGPYGPFVGPSCEPERIRPSADPGEEVSVSVSHKLVWTYILDAPLVHYAGGNVAFSPEFPQPSRSLGIELVVVDHRPSLPPTRASPT